MTLGDTRRCMHCNTDGVVISIRVTGQYTIAVLDCNHTCVYAEGDTTVTNRIPLGQRRVVCSACSTPFETYMAQSPMYEFCLVCRGDLGLNTDADAAQMLEILEQVPVEQQALFANEMKKKGKTEMSSSSSSSSSTPSRPAAPPVDAAAVLAGIRAQVEYGTLADTRDPAAPHRPTEYVIAKNGLFEMRHTDIADIVVQPKEVVGVQTELTPGIRLRLPQLPFNILTQTVAFFREVMAKRNGAEAIVQVWWRYAGVCTSCSATPVPTCPDCSGTGQVTEGYHLHVPEQQVSGGGVTHSSTFDRDGSGDWLHVMDIHSHNTMGAFWSGIDDNDEKKAPEGRMFGVIGKLNGLMPEWKWRMRVGKDSFLELKLNDVFAPPKEERINFHVTWDVVLAILGKADAQSVDAEGRLRLYCPVNPFADATFPAEWMTKVQSRSGYAGGHGWHGRGQQQDTQRHEPYQPTWTRYIYIKNSDDVLEEWECQGTVMKKTGYTLPLKPRVH